MGQRGPKPMPPELKAITGARQRHAVDLASGVHPAVKAPPMPHMLIGPARKEWKRVTPLLLELGLLTALDRAALTMYCEAWGRYAQLLQQLVDEQAAAVAAGRASTAPYFREMPSGIVRDSPLARALTEAREGVDRMLGHFGLSPAQRGRVTASRDFGDQPALPGFDDPVASKLSLLRSVS